MAKVVPGTEKYNEGVRRPGGFYLPNGPREGRFTTAAGKARFTVHPLPRAKLEPGQLLMMTVRSHDQYNTTIYGLQDRYRGLADERRVGLLNREDIAALGLHDKQVGDLTSHFPGQARNTPASKSVVIPVAPARDAKAFDHERTPEAQGQR